MSKEVKRYVPGYCESGGEIWAEMQEDNEGGWVRATDYDALLAERDALAKDAERYRWLRNTAMETGDVAPAVLMVDGECRPVFDEPGYGHASARSGATLDAAIDAALQGANP